MGYEYEIHSPDCGPPGQTSPNWLTVPAYRGLYIKGFTDPKRNAKPHPIRDLPRYFHVSYEGLGGGYGYEIKSVIAPLSIHKLLITRHLFKNVTFNNHPNGRKNNGGIHVSVSRNAFTRPVADKVFTFLHRTLTRSQALSLSERNPRTFNQFSPQHYDSYEWFNHYAIINQQNSNRYELRLFAAQQHLLLPALETADSLFSLAAEAESISMENWTAYLRGKSKYRELAAHIQTRIK